MAGRIFTKAVVLAAAAGAGAALVGFLITLALGVSEMTIVIITVVAAVATRRHARGREVSSRRGAPASGMTCMWIGLSDRGTAYADASCACRGRS